MPNSSGGLELIDFLVDAVATLLRIAKAQNEQLQQLGAVVQPRKNRCTTSSAPVLPFCPVRPEGRWRKIYIDLDTVIRAASVISSIGVIIGVIVAVYKVFQINRKQSDFIKSIEDEQTLLCYGLKGALQGLIEQGCNGPCKDALSKLEKHLNQKAHETNDI